MPGTHDREQEENRKEKNLESQEVELFSRGRNSSRVKCSSPPSSMRALCVLSYVAEPESACEDTKALNDVVSVAWLSHSRALAMAFLLGLA